jgi:hypothetical protein
MKRKWSWPFRKKTGHCISGRIGILLKQPPGQAAAQMENGYRKRVGGPSGGQRNASGLGHFEKRRAIVFQAVL